MNADTVEEDYSYRWVRWSHAYGSVALVAIWRCDDYFPHGRVGVRITEGINASEAWFNNWEPAT